MFPMSNTATPNNSTARPGLDPEFLAILRCPLTHSKLRLEGNFLIGETGGLKYPIRDGIPVMLIEEAGLPEGIASLDEFKAKFADVIR